MDPEKMLDALSVPFPENAIEQRPGGGNMMLDYVATETVIRRLNAVAKVWDFRITDKMVVDNLLVVWGELTIPGLGTRAGTGVQKLVGGEDMWKGAASDCLKKCAVSFGVAIHLYGPDLEAGELPASQKLPARGRTTSENTIPDDGDLPYPGGGGVTNKQIRAINAIGRAINLDPAEAKRMHGKGSATELTAAEADEFIARLRQQENAAKQGSLVDAARADRYTS